MSPTLELEAVAVAEQVVVMDKGKIEQASSARGIYADPASPYVARFMGGQNVLSGTVQSFVGGRAALRGAGGQHFELIGENQHLMVGSVVNFAVRRDEVLLAKAVGSPALGVNALRARVTMTEYQGIYVKVTLAIDLAPGQMNGADEFVAYVPEAVFFASAIQIDDAVVASWQTGSARILTGDANAFPRH